MCGGLAPVHAVDIAQYKDHFAVRLSPITIVADGF
jgi:hypothetical protein